MSLLLGLVVLSNLWLQEILWHVVVALFSLSLLFVGPEICNC